jgi:hypothetical protein
VRECAEIVDGERPERECGQLGDKEGGALEGVELCDREEGAEELGEGRSAMVLDSQVGR